MAAAACLVCVASRAKAACGTVNLHLLLIFYLLSYLDVIPPDYSGERNIY